MTTNRCERCGEELDSGILHITRDVGLAWHVNMTRVSKRISVPGTHLVFYGFLIGQMFIGVTRWRSTTTPAKKAR